VYLYWQCYEYHEVHGRTTSLSEVLTRIRQEHQREVLRAACEEAAQGTPVEQVLERFEDGRMNIMVEGTEVLRVVEVTRGQAYTTAMADTADEDLSPGEETEPVMELFRQIASVGGGDPEEDLTASGQALSYAIMARVDFPAEEKQRVLELRTESSRLSAIIELLARGLQALAQIEQIRERAQTNGKVPHGE